jgi:hypothetical protein
MQNVFIPGMLFSSALAGCVLHVSLNILKHWRWRLFMRWTSEKCLDTGRCSFENVCVKELTIMGTSAKMSSSHCQHIKQVGKKLHHSKTKCSYRNICKKIMQKFLFSTWNCKHENWAILSNTYKICGPHLLLIWNCREGGEYKQADHTSTFI